MAAHLEIRLAIKERRNVASYFGLLGLLLLGMIVAAALHGAVIGVLVAAAVGAVVAACIWRWSQMAVICQGERLIVRGFFSSRSIPRTTIRDFRIGGSDWSYPGRAIRVVLEDGSTVVLYATGRYHAPLEEYEPLLVQLRGWERDAEEYGPSPT